MLVIALWQAWVSLGHVQRIVAPTPWEVVQDIWSQPAAYLSNIARTVLYSIIGLTLGLVVGALIAVLCWFSSVLRGLLTPRLRPAPDRAAVAVVPIMALVFGTIQDVVGSLRCSRSSRRSSSCPPPRASPERLRDLFGVLGASSGRPCGGSPSPRGAELHDRAPDLRVDRDHRRDHRLP